ncbi:hypothetical protein NKH18_22130 [Streptomyces sp. M10(2022)]
MWRRASGSGEWMPESRLMVHVGDGGVPAQLFWGTEDGAQSSVGFSPDMASCYGHCRTAGGDVVEMRGELDSRAGHPDGTGSARGYEFDTEVRDAEGLHPAGRLWVLIDDGGEAPCGGWPGAISRVTPVRSRCVRRARPVARTSVTW